MTEAIRTARPSAPRPVSPEARADASTGRRAPRRWLTGLVAFCLTATACGGGREVAIDAAPASDGSTPRDAEAPPRPCDGGSCSPGADAGCDAGAAEPHYGVERLASRKGASALKLRPFGDGLLALLEAPRYGSAIGARSLLALDASGAERFAYAPREDEILLDFAVHGSGEATVVAASAERFVLVRLARDGSELAREPLADALLVDDPYFPPDARPDPTPSELRPSTDASPEARVTEAGEAVVVALRTDARALLAYRFTWQASAFTRTWRALLVPAHAPGIPVLPDTATFDTFGQTLLGHAVHLAVDSDGRVYLATAVAGDRFAIQQQSWKQVNAHLSLHGTEAPARSERLSGVLPQLLTSATLLIALSADGSYRYTRVLDFERAHELYGLRLIGSELYLLGRTHGEPDAASGFDAFLAKVDPEAGRPEFARSLDLDRGDLFFDLAEGEGMLLAVGATGWTQNPEGFSVSPASDRLAVLLEPKGGALVTRITLEKGLRFNELRSVFRRAARTFEFAGSEDGPSSHTAADGAHAILYLARLASATPRCGATASGR